MRLGPFRLTRHRAVRALAGVVAAFLLSGHVLAAAGLCVVRAPTASLASEAAEADEHGCIGHEADTASADSTTPKHHCPTDDPSAQSRTVDVPAAQAVALAAAMVLHWTIASLHDVPPLAEDDPSGPQPLYARLQRLRL